MGAAMATTAMEITVAMMVEKRILKSVYGLRSFVCTGLEVE
jgi:hypothetical protein